MADFILLKNIHVINNLEVIEERINQNRSVSKPENPFGS